MCEGNRAATAPENAACARMRLDLPRTCGPDGNWNDENETAAIVRTGLSADLLALSRLKPMFVVITDNKSRCDGQTAQN